MIRRILVGAVALALCLALSAGVAHAPTTTGVTIHVDCTNTTGIEDGSPEHPYTTVQEGIDAAFDGDTVVVRPCTYYENIDFLGKAITVTSTDPLDAAVVAATVIDGGGAGSVVTFASSEGSGSVLTGMTVRNGSGTRALYGKSGGGIYCVSASPIVTGNVITENSVEGAGGGVYCEDASSPVLRANVISNNTAAEGAGIDCMFDCNAVIEGNTITGNVADPAWGGGISLWRHSSPTIANNTIVGNSSANCGGGIDVYSHSSPLIIGNLIADNIVTSQHFPGGAGIWCQQDCAPIITGNVITGNRLTYLLDKRGLGGGIATYRNDLDPIITDNVITDNVARDGGGIGCFVGTAVIARNTIAGNSSGARGGGVYVESEGGVSLAGSITDNTITDNHAGTDGAGISLHDTCSPEIAGNVITGNTAGERGGGIDCYEHSSPVIIGNAISGNTATYGGALGCRWDSSPSLTNNVITRNNGAYGGVYCYDDCSPTIKNCTIADNEIVGIVCEYGSFPTVCNSIIWGRILAIPVTSMTATHSDACTPAGMPWPGENNICVDPHFVDPENGDYHLLPTSPCIGMGTNDCVAPDDVDIDGQPRPWPPWGMADMGADEVVPPPSCGITYHPTSPTSDDMITFVSGAADPYDTVVSVDWDFGDGSTASADPATHQYAAPGTYEAAVTVCNAAGLCATCATEVTVAVPCDCDVAIDRTHCKMPAAGHIGQCKSGQIGAKNMSASESCDVVLRVTDNAGVVVFESEPVTIAPGRRIRIRFDHCYTADEVGRNLWTWEVWPLECNELTPWSNVQYRRVNVQPGVRSSPPTSCRCGGCGGGRPVGRCA